MIHHWGIRAAGVTCAALVALAMAFTPSAQAQAVESGKAGNSRASSAAASNNVSCAQPRTQVHERICNSSHAPLRSLDRDLKRWYDRALANSKTREQLQAEQQEWFQDLDHCLEADPAEPTAYVCDAVRSDDAKHSICQRDLCLARRYGERARELHQLATAGQRGKYVLSSQWPTDIRGVVQLMAEEDRPLCRAVATNLSYLEPMTKPLQPTGGPD